MFNEIMKDTEAIARLEERVRMLEDKISLLFKFMSIVITMELSILAILVKLLIG